jgi:hypothetical protein
MAEIKVVITWLKKPISQYSRAIKEIMNGDYVNLKMTSEPSILIFN